MKCLCKICSIVLYTREASNVYTTKTCKNIELKIEKENKNTRNVIHCLVYSRGQ